MKWRLTVDFEGEREAWGLDEPIAGPLDAALDATGGLSDFIKGRVVGVAFGIKEED